MSVIKTDEEKLRDIREKFAEKEIAKRFVSLSTLKDILSEIRPVVIAR